VRRERVDRERKLREFESHDSPFRELW
jgi:hypothetical protein